MANGSRITRGSIPRALQYGLDKIIDQEGKSYKGLGDRIFQEVKTDKSYYESMQMAGMGVAGELGEGDAITYDSVDQSWVFRIPVRTFEKSARITRNMIKDNVYENLLPRIAREQLKALAQARDISQAAVLNGAFGSTTYGDGKKLCASDHPLQAGGTNSNVLATDLSEESLEAAVLAIDAFKNDDGLLSDYVPRRLIVPSALRFEAKRVLKNENRPGTADRDINVLNMEGDIPEIVVWKRISDSDSYFIQTNAEEGLITIRREGVFTSSAQDFETYDTKLTAAERYANSVGDHRNIIGSPGA
jgi:hypothetical protein